MMKYSTELHAHTMETSRCAKDKAKILVRNYLRAGYSTLVTTDHLSPSTFEVYKKASLSWNDKVDIFLKGHRAAKAAAEKTDLTVLLGMELRFARKGGINDYLVYGVTEDFLRKNGDLLEMRLSAFAKLAHKNGLLIFQAHPFRNGMTVVNPEYLDGYEIYNACVRHNSRNGVAQKWALLHKKPGIAGSDYHQSEDAARGGILTAQKIETNEMLLAVMRQREYELIRK